VRRALFVVALLGLASPARAGVEDTFGLGPRPMALAGSYAARPGDFSAVYYNPAGLAPRHEASVKGGFFELSLAGVYGHPSLHVTRQGGGEIPTPEPADTLGGLAGTRFSVGQPFGIEGLNMGVSAYVPKHLFQWAIVPDDDVQWALLTDRTQVLSSHFALAYRILPWLSVGAGLRLLFDVQTLTRGEVTDVHLETDPETGRSVVKTSTRLGTNAEVFGRVSPIFGLLVTPIDELRLGLGYRHKSYVDDWGDTRLAGIPDLGNLGYTHRFAHYFEPSQTTLAASVNVSNEVEVSVDLTYARWSEAVSTNHNFFYRDATDGGVWGDTLVPALGISWRALPGLSLFGGYRFQKSPLDNFGGPTNLLDNDRHVIGTGLEVGLGETTKLTFALNHVVLVERTETKDYTRFPSDEAWQENPGYPGYSYGGHVTAGSLGVESRW
jgi:long-subunit fatty acid transport protein